MVLLSIGSAVASPPHPKTLCTPTSFTELASEGEQDVGEFCSAEKRGCLAHIKQRLSFACR